jgi:hypothetical protein
MRPAALILFALLAVPLPVSAQEVGAATECSEAYRALADPSTGGVDAEDAADLLGDDAVQGDGELSRSEFMTVCLAARGGSEGMGAAEDPERK